MLGPLKVALEDFGVSKSNGFLPEELPLKRLSHRYYSSWESIIGRLPSLLRTKSLRGEVDRLSTLSVSRLRSGREWQRAYLLLSFMTHAYIWGGDYPSQYLPPSITIPFLEVSASLGLPPTATYSALNLWNFSSSSADLSHLERLSVLHTFTGTTDEEWFYLISVAIEARGAKLIPVMLNAMDAVRADEARLVSEHLLEFADIVQEIGSLLERMYERCSPEIFYHQIRPFLAGSKNTIVDRLPKGVFYDEGDGHGCWRQYSGGSNAQSSLIQFFDVVLGVEHHATRGMGEAGKGFLKQMRDYMPGCHRRFLDHVESIANIREYAMNSASSVEVTTAYNLAVARLSAFRDIHIQIVARYIIGPSNRSSTRGLSGTGGTELVPFLKQSRNETRNSALKPM